ncbi:hypothetical protein [Sinorhizobium meliloti]|uniref:Uncharacterized protein n=1 Tax=Rhizobium meliloti (strain 1021) TaxID=266834 RepID=Q92XC1_RHIME|nr:hypothetical protein [Sinorhizobium meliloti]AGG71039.1 Hypothetical protein SM2011_b20038 [Sinorhizobium meliloti 2011]ASP63019.1 hypothetical protein CDO30_25635 [Sinorhizobium meliloti]MQW46498.1 hypothetical protein [Sinorhizobium meliloti]PTD26593.1 hypothetical protein C5N13_20365 [Sinorhizobium meliloti]RVL44734.1 hypothetical protein CN146_14605 [Sinorhizobium meliloti]
MQALGPRRQSTLIAFKGTAETAGSVGDTEPLPGFGNVAKAVFGAVLLVIGIAIVTGVDKQLEAALVEASRPGSRA